MESTTEQMVSHVLVTSRIQPKDKKYTNYLFSIIIFKFILKVLQLLRVAWERRLTFTIGTSVTTGATNTIVWNEIHHKTESTSNHSGHGYPDENYLDNVLAELAAQGVREREEEGGGGGDDESTSDDDL